jgi:hypothetical protein
MATLKPKPKAPAAPAKTKPAKKQAVHESDYGSIKKQQHPSGDFTDLRLAKGQMVWLDVKLEGEDKVAAGGQAYITLDRCSVVDPEPLVYSPLKPGGPNVVHNQHDYTEVVFDMVTISDDAWLDTDLGALCVFLPVLKKHIFLGYPAIEEVEKRTVKYLSASTMTWTGVAGVESVRPQVINCCHFLCVLCVMSHLIPPLRRTSSTPAT